MNSTRIRALPPELLQEARKLQFEAQRLAEQGIAGRYRSAFRGQGIEFEEVREYFPGDDVRSIDWKVTAKMNRPFVKSYREERELTVMIAVDVSASSLAATRGQLRASLIAKVGAFLTLIALRNNDRVGLVTFSDHVQAYHPPRKARGAVWRILHEVLNPEGHHPGTNLAALFSFLNNVLKRKSIVFVISDFIDSNFDKELAILGKRHDVTAIIISDRADYDLPDAGLVSIRNPETDEVIPIDLSNSVFREAYHEQAAARRAELKGLLRRYRISAMEFFSDKPFIDDFRRYFDKRRHHLYHSRIHAQSL